MDINTNDVVGHGADESLVVGGLIGVDEALDGPDEEGPAAAGDVGEALV